MSRFLMPQGYFFFLQQFHSDCSEKKTKAVQNMLLTHQLAVLKSFK